MSCFRCFRISDDDDLVRHIARDAIGVEKIDAVEDRGTSDLGAARRARGGPAGLRCTRRERHRPL